MSIDSLTSPEPGHTQSPIIPEEAKGLCWGGFFLSFFWAIGNSTWIGLLSIVPLIGLPIPFILLFKGREMAWKNNNWQSVEHFNKIQKRWSLAGILFITLVFCMGVMLVIAIPGFKNYGAKARMSEAKIKLASVYVAQQVYYGDNDKYALNLDDLEYDQYPGRYIITTITSDSNPETIKLCPDCTLGEQKFKIMAIGNIDDDTTVDVWVIDQEKLITHLVNDLAD